MKNSVRLMQSSASQRRLQAAEASYTEIVDGLMDLVQAVPESSDRIYGMLEKLRTVLDAGQEVVEANRRMVEDEKSRS